MKLPINQQQLYYAKSNNTEGLTLANIFVSLYNKAKQSEWTVNAITISKFNQIKQIAEQIFPKTPDHDDYVILFTMIIQKIQANNINGLIELMGTKEFWTDINKIITKENQWKNFTTSARIKLKP